ncbi:MAG: hypothetical protein LC118_05970 [Dehalococcoidia bacterium]|nr:hypothetical protein [Dehalococcoidia bacterium]
MPERWKPGETRFLGLPRGRGIIAGVVLLLVITAIVAGIVAWLGSSGISLALAALVGAALSAFLLAGQSLGFASVLAGRTSRDEDKKS